MLIAANIFVFSMKIWVLVVCTGITFFVAHLLVKEYYTRKALLETALDDPDADLYVIELNPKHSRQLLDKMRQRGQERKPTAQAHRLSK